MKNIVTIAKKEWLSYFSSPVGYIFAGLLLLIVNWMFFGDLFVIGQADLRNYWGTLSFLLSIFVPAIAMGLLADEKKNGTWELLLSLPVNEIELVVGKFLGCALYLLFTIGLSVPTVIIVGLLGKLDIGLVAGGYVSVVLLGLAYLALGLWMSSLTNQAIVAFLGATVILLINNLMGQEVFLARMPLLIRELLSGLSLSFRAGRFSAGLLEIKDLIFFGSWIFIFLNLSVLWLKLRNK